MRPDRNRSLEDVLLGRRPPCAYIASALSNADLNADVTQALVTHSWRCFLPQRDAPTSGDGGETAAANIRGLLEADIVLALGYNMGRDTAWEVGFAAGHGIPVVLVHSSAGTPERDIMVFHSAAAILRVSTETAPALLPALLNGFLTNLRERIQGA
jgi:nucleoside 2-deoxyribosyltransferase